MADLKVKSRAGLIQSSAKLLLRNVIRHTDTHNRLVEEDQMWQLYEKMKRNNNADDEDLELANRMRKRKDREEDKLQHTLRDPDVKYSFLYDDRQIVKDVRSSGRWCRAHMDSDDNDTRNQTSGLSAGGSTYWMRQLEKAEAADGERWGHAGYKELYPQDFQSDRSGSSKEDSDSDSSSTGDERRRRKRKKSKSDIREKKRLKREKKRKKSVRKISTDECEIYEKRKKSKRKRRREEEDTDSDNRQTKRSRKGRSGSDRKKKRK